MDSNIEVALKVKLKRLLDPPEDKFLSFPMGTGFTFEELGFMDEPSNLTAEQLQQRYFDKAEFARRLNLIPKDGEVVFSADSTRFLWDEYRNVLSSADLAESILTDNERSQLEEAEDFLTDVVDRDGARTVVRSQAETKYYQYREIHEEANLTYLDEKLTVENLKMNLGEASEDEKLLVKEWDTYREKQLREARDRAFNDWVNLGFKNEVERYQGTKKRLGQKHPLLYTRTYLDDLAASNEGPHPEYGGETYTTFYSPRNSFDNDLQWIRVNMRRQEINSLIRSAPSELQRFVTGDLVNIESISLDYKNVTIMRPWFTPEFFESRYWRLPDQAEIMSNGGIPRQGKLPAFITSMIVTRNIEVTRKTNETADSPAPFKLSFLAKHINFKQNILQMRGGQFKPVTVNMPPALFMPAAKPAVRPAVVASATVRSTRPSNYVRAKYTGTSVTRPANATPKRQGTKKQGDEFVKETIELDGVAVIALDCRRIAKSPNPDESLTWL